MAKTFETIEQVQSARKAGQGVVMNMVAAIAALKATPTKAARASSPRNSEFKNDVHNLFIAAKNEGVDNLSKNQIVAMYRAAKGLSVLSDAKEEAQFQKKFYEHCLANSDQPSKKCANPTYHYENGVFSLK